MSEESTKDLWAAIWNVGSPLILSQVTGQFSSVMSAPSWETPFQPKGVYPWDKAGEPILHNKQYIYGPPHTVDHLWQEDGATHLHIIWLLPTCQSWCLDCEKRCALLVCYLQVRGWWSSIQDALTLHSVADEWRVQSSFLQEPASPSPDWQVGVVGGKGHWRAKLDPLVGQHWWWSIGSPPYVEYSRGSHGSDTRGQRQIWAEQWILWRRLHSSHTKAKIFTRTPLSIHTCKRHSHSPNAYSSQAKPFKEVWRLSKDVTRRKKLVAGKSHKSLIEMLMDHIRPPGLRFPFLTHTDWQFLPRVSRSGEMFPRHYLEMLQIIPGTSCI